MEASTKIRGGAADAWRWLAGPERWTRRRTAGEAVLALLMAVLAAGTEELLGRDGWWPAAVAASATVLSLLRRRFPATVLVVTGALAPLLPGYVVLLMLVGWSAGRHIADAGRALGAFTGAYVLYATTMLLDAWDWHSALRLAFVNTIYFLATTVVPGLAHRYWIQRRTLLHALQDRNRRLLRERSMIVLQARLRERQRIAQDMHDSLGHQLALISVHTGALEVDRELTGRQREAVSVLRNASVTAMHELREVVGILRDGIEAPVDAGPGGAGAVDESRRGTAGIEALVEAGRAAGKTVGLKRTGDGPPLMAAADHAAYRIVQEALTNAYKHAPGAAIGVELRYEPDAFVVEVVNAAPARPAGDAVSGGQGLTGLHERARLVGGMVHAGPVDGGGFRVAGVLPYGGGGESAPQAAPLVDAADDFRQQSTSLPRRDAEPVMDWRSDPLSDLSLTERELAMALREGGSGTRSRGSGVALGCGIAAAAMVLLVLAVGFGAFYLVRAVDKAMIDPAEYERISVGTAEKDVRDRLPSGDTVVTSGLHGKGPKEPEGSTCLVLMSSEVPEDVTVETEPVFRFCFKDGKLIEKKAYDVRR
ncbi:histidine kinase [Streptomyces sp. HUAS MG47]|uniref:sensor histidine kinase n=1 Tax=Streptomyces solicamelliae TaxID=3231716 RepID=UPI003877DB07